MSKTEHNHIKVPSCTEPTETQTFFRVKHAAQEADADTLKSQGQDQYARLLMLKKYGLSPDKYDEILKSQGGHCAACPEVINAGKRLYVDHDHETGMVRGLLCNNCNTAIGMLKDNFYRVKCLLDYIYDSHI